MLLEKKIEPILKGMAVGDVKYYPIERLKSVQTSCSQLGTILKRKYTTTRFTQLGYIQVTREL